MKKSEIKIPDYQDCVICRGFDICGIIEDGMYCKKFETELDSKDNYPVPCTECTLAFKSSHIENKDTIKPQIDVGALIELCEEYFVDYYTQPYTGARKECFYCGESMNKPHKNNCPTVRYKKIVGR